MICTEILTSKNHATCRKVYVGHRSIRSYNYASYKTNIKARANWTDPQQRSTASNWVIASSCNIFLVHRKIILSDKHRWSPPDGSLIVLKSITHPTARRGAGNWQMICQITWRPLHHDQGQLLSILWVRQSTSNKDNGDRAQRQALLNSSVSRLTTTRLYLDTQEISKNNVKHGKVQQVVHTPSRSDHWHLRRFT